MNVEKIKKQWNDYCDDFENSEEMDIEKHISMALKVGGLIQKIEKQQEELNQWREEFLF
jgi:LEA14-like dessication related protein